MSTKEVSKSLLRKFTKHAPQYDGCPSNDVKIVILLLLCVFVPGSQVSHTVHLIKKKIECFLSLLVVLQRLVSNHQEGINVVLTQVVVSCCSLKVSSHVG